MKITPSAAEVPVGLMLLLKAPTIIPAAPITTVAGKVVVAVAVRLPFKTVAAVTVNAPFTVNAPAEPVVSVLMLLAVIVLVVVMALAVLMESGYRNSSIISSSKMLILFNLYF